VGLRIGIIGCGDVAYRHYLPALRSVADRASVAAVADTRADAADRMIRSISAWSPDTKAFGDVAQMLRSADLDGVFNLTPAPLHGAINQAIVGAGVACYSEKPLASTVREADELINLARNRRTLLLCAPGSAVSSRVRWLRALADSRRFGKPTLAVAHHADPGPADWGEYTGDPTTFYQPGVGPVFDHGVYRLHEMTTVMGAVARVQAMGTIALPERLIRGGPLTGEKITVTTQDHVLMQLEFRSGALGQLLASFATADTLAPWLEIHFERGVVSFGGKSWEDDAPISVFDASDGAEQGTWQRATDAPTDDGGVVEAGARHFVDCLLGFEQPVLTAEHARHVLDVILAAYRSIDSGTAQEVATSF
jgi:predicted dehydrogenase